MGVVCRATQLSLNREVAVKILRDFDRTGPAYARFRREVQIMTKLDHEALVTVYDYNLESDFPFLVMELVPGDTLARLVRKLGPLEVAVIRQILPRILDAVAHLHSRDILHRDLKPANIMILPEGGIRILDFGLARGGDHTLLTRDQQVIGTVRFMAPEVIRGAAATTAADLFGIGLILYHMLTASWPWSGRTVPEYLRSVSHDDPKPLTQWRSDIPDDLIEMTEILLKMDPASRPAAPDALKTFRKLQRERARRSKRIQGRELRIRRDARALVAGEALLGALGVGTMWSWFMRGSTPRKSAIQVAATPLSNATLVSNARPPRIPPIRLLREEVVPSSFSVSVRVLADQEATWQVVVKRSGEDRALQEVRTEDAGHLLWISIEGLTPETPYRLSVRAGDVPGGLLDFPFSPVSRRNGS